MAKQLKKSPVTRKILPVRQTFSFKAPAAKHVAVAGDFTDWQRNPISLRKEDDGIWRVTVTRKSGEHRYRFLVDGEWRDDPTCSERTANPYGSQDAVMRVANSMQV